MQTYFADAQELWEKIQESGNVLSRDFELSHYGDEEDVTGYVLLYKGPTHDIYRVNKTVELFYNKLVDAGFKNNVELAYRDMHRPEKYNEIKKEAVIELYPGMYSEEEHDPF